MKTSESIINISKALIEFQGKLVKVSKDAVNPHFKNRYASLSQIIESVQKPLNECGMAVIQLPSGDHGLETILMHSSGEFIAETYKMNPQRDDPQGLGSAITYQRRYALGAFLCLNIDEDDDAQKASNPAKPIEKAFTVPKPVNKMFPEDNREWISQEQFQSVIQRFKAGERHIIDKAFNTFKMRRELKEQLLALKNNH